jgi:uncharacterized protein
MQQRLNLITLGVSDLAVSKNFYSNCFGWKPLQETDGIVFYMLNGFILSLYPSHELAEDAKVSSDGSGFKKFTLAYTCSSEAEVDFIFNEAVTKGASSKKHPEKVFWGGYSGYIADPDENLWEIAYNPFLKMDEAGSVVGIIE